jgi:biopolymer transport protein ExbB
MELLARAQDYILAGGPVMWPLLAASLWMWSLILRKTFWLIPAKRETVDLGSALACLEGRRSPEKSRGPRGDALALFLEQRTGRKQADLRLWRAAVHRQYRKIWRHLTGMTVLAAVAPLLGLLGTVTGMIETFAVIQMYGTGNAQALASGISEALITTQTGLLVAILGLFAAYALRRQARGVQQRLQTFRRGVERWLQTQETDLCFA